MSLVTGQATATTASTTIFNQPPGPSVVTVTSDTASAATAYVGAGTAVTSANGAPLPAGGSISWATYPNSRGGAVSIVTGSTTATIGWVISSSG